MQLTKEQFKTIRTELQYTQKEFAEMLGLTIRMITYYESGQRPVGKTVSILTKRIYQDEKQEIHMTYYKYKIISKAIQLMVTWCCKNKDKDSQMTLVKTQGILNNFYEKHK